jgi:hypothetical protein
VEPLLPKLASSDVRRLSVGRLLAEREAEAAERGAAAAARAADPLGSCSVRAGRYPLVAAAPFLRRRAACTSLRSRLRRSA